MFLVLLVFLGDTFLFGTSIAHTGLISGWTNEWTCWRPNFRREEGEWKTCINWKTR